jgi:hypothetical protein
MEANEGNNIRDTVNAFARLSPHKLISLWDMIQFLAAKIFRAIENLQSDEHWLDYLWRDDFKESRSRQIKRMTDNVAALEIISAELNLIESRGRCERFRGLLELDAARQTTFLAALPSITRDQMRSEIEGILGAFTKELGERKFAFIPTDRVEFFEQDNAFGDTVKNQLPIVAAEIKNAANCIAADLNTAAVFHLMRVVETGLRELARSLRVKINKTPLDYAGWDSVVREIDDKLTAKIPKARGPKKTKSLQFKHDLLADFKAFEVERNEVMHARRHYNQKEAHGIYLRVRDFMQRLASRISE